MEVAQNVTAATNPTEAVILGIGTVAKECSPPYIKYPIKCTILMLQITTAIASTFNPVTGAFRWSMVIGSAKQILLEEL